MNCGQSANFILIPVSYTHLDVYKRQVKYPISFSDINLPLIKDYESYLFNKEVGKGKTCLLYTS